MKEYTLSSHPKFIHQHRSYLKDDFLIIESSEIIGYNPKVLLQWVQNKTLTDKQPLFELFCSKYQSFTKSVYLPTKSDIAIALPEPKNNFLKSTAKKFQIKNFALDAIEVNNPLNIARVIPTVKIPLYGKASVSEEIIYAAAKELEVVIQELKADLSTIFGEFNFWRTLPHRSNLDNLHLFYDNAPVILGEGDTQYFTFNKVNYILNFDGYNFTLESKAPLIYDTTILPTKRQSYEVFNPYEAYFKAEIEPYFNDLTLSHYLGEVTLSSRYTPCSMTLFDRINSSIDGVKETSRLIKFYAHGLRELLDLRDLMALIHILKENLRVEQDKINQIKQNVLIKKEGADLKLNKRSPVYFGSDFKIVFDKNSVTMHSAATINKRSYQREKLLKKLVSDKKKKEFASIIKKWDSFFDEISVGEYNFIIETSKEGAIRDRKDLASWQEVMSENIVKVEFKLIASVRNLESNFIISDKNLGLLAKKLNKAQSEFNKELRDYFKIRTFSFGRSEDREEE